MAEQEGLDKFTKGGRFRLRYININTKKTLEGKTVSKKIDFPFLTFMLPDGMKTEEAFLVVSYILQTMAKEGCVKKNSLAGVRSADVMLNSFGFVRLHQKEENCFEMLVYGDGLIETEKQLRKNGCPEVCWLKHDIQRCEIEKIYERCNLKLPQVEKEFKR